MNVSTSRTIGRRLTLAAVSTLAIVELTAPVGAALVPAPDSATAPASESGTDSATKSVTGSSDRPCFMVRMPWNDALDLPQPRCGTSVPVSGAERTVDHEACTVWVGGPRRAH